MKKKRILIPVIALAVLLVLGAAVFAAGNYGSAEDPLIAKSYLDSVLRPELENSLKTELNDAVSDMRSGSGEFSLLVLSKGQSVRCEIGCEILPRLGSAVANGASSPVLVDTTAGGTVANGTALKANHLYLVSIADNGFQATADNTYVLISGGYVVE